MFYIWFIMTLWFIITKWDIVLQNPIKVYYKMRQLLQNELMLLQNGTFIIKCIGIKCIVGAINIWSNIVVTLKLGIKQGIIVTPWYEYIHYQTSHTIWISVGSASTYLFKTNNENTRTVSEICSKSTIKALEWLQWHHWPITV